ARGSRTVCRCFAAQTAVGAAPSARRALCAWKSPSTRSRWAHPRAWSVRRARCPRRQSSPRVSAPVRILCVGNIYPPQAPGGGYELTWQSSVRLLRARGHEVRVLTSDHREAGVDRPDEADVHRELRWYWRDHAFPRLPWRERLELERRNAATFGRHLEEHRTDVVCWWGM